MQIQVSVIGGAADGLDVSFTQLPIALGREGDPALPIADRWASRHHCELFEQAGRLYIRDLASKHGTHVNGKCIDECPLKIGDRVMVGLTAFVVEDIAHAHTNPQPMIDRESGVSA